MHSFFGTAINRPGPLFYAQTLIVTAQATFHSAVFKGTNSPFHGSPSTRSPI